MLDRGFWPAIRRISGMLPKQRHTMFFSATMPEAIASLAKDLLREPVKVEVTPVATTAERVNQRAIHVSRDGKRTVLEMTGLLTNLNDQDLADLAAYFASQKGSVGAADPKLVARGEQLFRGGNLEKGLPACTGCHSPNGAGNAAASFPRLSGQHATYIAKQLTDFRKEEAGRANDGDAMTMRTIARKLSDEDIAALSSYIQGLH